MTLNGQQVGQTKVIKRTLNPQWDESFLLELPSSPDLTDRLVLEVYDKDFSSRGDFLGKSILMQVSFPHTDIRFRRTNARGLRSSTNKVGSQVWFCKILLTAAQEP